MNQTKQAFTLIELLVVVLIIGILAAVALPQYRIAVGKSRFAQGVVLCDAVYKAQQIYRLSNGTFTNQFTDLDIDILAGGVLNETKNNILVDGISVWIGGSDAVGYICSAYVSGLPASYFYYYSSGSRQCRASVSHVLANKICKSMTSKTPYNDGSQNIYSL